MAVTRLTYDAVYDNVNGSILSVTNISIMGPSPVQARDLLLFYNATFNNPLNPNSLDISFLLTVGVEVGPTSGYSANKALLALPYIIFQPMSPWFESSDPFREPSTNPTTYSGGRAISRIIIEKWTVIAFAIIMLGVYFWCIIFIVWMMFHPSPPITQFPLLDFASRVISGTSSVQNILSDGLFSGFRKMLQDKILLLGVIPQKYGERAGELISIAQSAVRDVNDGIRKAQKFGSNDRLLGSDIIVDRESNVTESSADVNEIQEITGLEAESGMIEESAAPFLGNSSREIERIGLAFKKNEIKPLKNAWSVASYFSDQYREYQKKF